MTKKKEREVVGTNDPTANAMLEVGTYPAHITGVSLGEANTKIGHAITYTLDYKIAKEASKLKQLLYEKGHDGNFKLDEDGNKVVIKDDNDEELIVSCQFAVDKQFKYHTTFLFTEEKGKGANTRYSELLKIANIKTEFIEVQPGIKIEQLVKLDEEDLVGKPVMITIDYKPSPTKDTRDLPKEQQEFRYWARVVDVTQWKSGKEISEEILKKKLPF